MIYRLCYIVVVEFVCVHCVLAVGVYVIAFLFSFWSELYSTCIIIVEFIKCDVMCSVR